jgi:hypothetical protein
MRAKGPVQMGGQEGDAYNLGRRGQAIWGSSTLAWDWISWTFMSLQATMTLITNPVCKPCSFLISQTL